MAKAPQISTKRLAISRSNAQMVAVVAVAAFVTMFCLVAAHAVFTQNQFQSRLTKANQTASDQLKSNITAFNTLLGSYQKFDASNPNIIGGNLTGTGDKDGDNAKIILDALPSVYDFPALTSSLEKVLNDQHLIIGGISGTDDQINQQSNTGSASPTAVPIPFSFTINNASYAQTEQLIATLQTSIRPIQIDTLSLTGASNSMTMTVTAHTYYQPSKTLNITKTVIR